MNGTESGAPALDLRVAVPDDAAAIAALHSASWRDAYGPVLPAGALPETLEAQHRALWDRVLAPRPEPTLVLTARRGGNLVGFIAVHRDADDPDLDFLAALHIRPGLRSGGLGARLMLEIAQRRADAGRLRMWCWVLRENVAGRRFYARLGALEGVHQTVPLTETTECVDIRLDFPRWADLAARCEAALASRQAQGR